MRPVCAAASALACMRARVDCVCLWFLVEYFPELRFTGGEARQPVELTLRRESVGCVGVHVLAHVRLCACVMRVLKALT